MSNSALFRPSRSVQQARYQYKNAMAILACLLLLTSVPSQETFGQTESSAGKFTPLYNGKNLAGWDVKDGKIEAWKADGELLSCVADGGGWLRTNRMYSDFILKLEFRIPEGGNSGVGLRFPLKGAVHHDGMEIQILDDDAPKHANLKAAQYTGGVYYQAPAKRGASKPVGEWNTYVITCAGQHVKVVLNDTVINDIQLDDYSEGVEGHTPLADRPTVGYVGLQSHGSRVDFRNIEIQDLTTRTDSGLEYFDFKEGKGDVVPAGAIVTVHYTGRFLDGKKFDSSRDRGEPSTFPLDSVIKGWSEGVAGMKVGGRRKLIVPPQLAYGERGIPGVIPENATLVFDVEVIQLK